MRLVFEITHLRSGRGYIGWTWDNGRVSPAKILDRYISSARIRRGPLYDAILEFGRDQFGIEILDRVPNLRAPVLARELRRSRGTITPSGFNSDYCKKKTAAGADETEREKA